MENENWIVIYRPHGQLNCETKYYGPFDCYEDADTALCELPAIGTYDNHLHMERSGVKYIQQLSVPEGWGIKTQPQLLSPAKRATEAAIET